tara:strand:- start:52 stop:345 length:294 start_codon:yes stop_codon:yes gene_type:complete
MATIIRRKSDNVVTHYAQSADFDSGYLIFIDVDGARTHSIDVTSDAYEIINDVVHPAKPWSLCFSYIDGTYTILTDVVDDINRIRSENNYPELEVEI